MDIKNFNESIENIDIPYKFYIPLVTIFIVIILLVIINNNNFYEYYKGYASVEEGVLKTSVFIEDLDNIKNNNIIEIDGRDYFYNINSIDNENYVYENTFYKVVNLKILGDVEPFDSYVKFSIITKKDTLINYFLRTLKGG